MTKEEAITKLTNVLNDDIYSWSPEVLAAFGMAVEALKGNGCDDDLISRQAALDCFHDWGDKRGDVHTADEMPEYRAIEELPAVQPASSSYGHENDVISRRAAIHAIECVDWYHQNKNKDMVHGADSSKHQPWYKSQDIYNAIQELPSAQPEWNNHTVACLLAELFDDTCACNYNDIDEWLPEKCELLDSCPNPVGVACWEQFLKHKAERRTDECLNQKTGCT